MTSSNSPIDSKNWIDRINESDEYIKDMFSWYNNGWINRGEDDEKKIKDRIKTNILVTLNYVEEVLDELVKLGITANDVFLKFNSLVDHTVLITVPTEDYLSDNFFNIYSISKKKERSSKSEDYGVRFNYTFDDGDIDEDALRGDGFHKSHSSSPKNSASQ